MGLNVDIDLLEESYEWPEQLIDAVKDMKRATYGSAVRPSNARRLIRKYVDPLKPDIEISARIRAKHPAWEDFRKTGELISNESGDRMEESIGSLLIYLPDWSGSRKPLKYLSRTYCDLCWRHVIGQRKFCAHHDPVDKQSNYRYARRILYNEGFEQRDSSSGRSKYRNSLPDWVTGFRLRDQLEANQVWNQVVGGQVPISNWLAKYRPRVANMLEKELAKGVSLSAARVLSVMDTADSKLMSPQIYNAHIELHSLIQQDLRQLSGMLMRAEIWLTIEGIYKRNHKKGRPRINRK